jgi:hypothetical protein
VEARSIAGKGRARPGRWPAKRKPSRLGTVSGLSPRDRPQQKPRQRVRARCRRHLCPEPGHRLETLSRPERTEDVRRAGNFADADRRAEGHDAVARRDRVNPRRHGRVEATVLRCADAPSTRSLATKRAPPINHMRGWSFPEGRRAGAPRLTKSSISSDGVSLQRGWRTASASSAARA